MKAVPPPKGSVEEAVALLELDRNKTGAPLSRVAAFLDVSGETLARVAGAIVLVRRAGRLHERRSGDRAAFGVCLVRADLIRLESGALALESLAIGPFFRSSEPDPATNAYRLLRDPAAAVTGALLRVVSPERILREATASLGLQVYMARLGVGLGDIVLDERQRQAIARAEAATPAQARLRDLAVRYLELLAVGEPHPLVVLAAETGLSREQVRDRLHRARLAGYLLPATASGKVDGRPGPKLLEALTSENREEH